MTTHGLHDGTRGLDAGCFQKGRGQIREIHEISDAPTGSLDAIRPAYGQRNVVGVQVSLSFDSGEGHAVIGGGDHQRLIQKSALLEQA